MAAPRRSKPKGSVTEALNALALECAALPDFDMRSPDEIIGYDENGMW
jgi:antitoxin VapB